MLIVAYDKRINQEALMGSDCELVLINDESVIVAPTHAFRKDFEFMEDFNYVISSFTDRTIRDIIDQIPAGEPRQCEADKSPDRTLSVVQVQGVFWLLLGGIISAVGCFFLEAELLKS